MKSHTSYIWMNTKNRYEIVNITGAVEEELKKSGIKEGLCLVNAMHITASVFINDNERGLHKDFLEWLEKLAPYSRDGYNHNLTGEDNGDAHIKRTLMGREVVIAVTKGKFDFGPWEQLFYGEFDGQREKRVLIKIIGE
ncbi:MAG: secondary thiamine-phosphate synthase enzyme [Elusimicrobia bacterium CG08_land_8_20_14_0_20_51_18]|nr:MAG: secondary thiamine-phosphate synthase enzyme [Elusimicrobia bacterium CG08_land_8_20_14_0_20_51_18]